MTALSLAQGVTSAETIHGRDEFLLPGMLHLYEKPLVLVEGDGVRVKIRRVTSTSICSPGF